MRRYREAFGRASRQDLAQFALLRQPQVRPAFDRLGVALVTLQGAVGATLFDVPDAPLPDDDAPAPPRPLAMWDSFLLAYEDRGRMIPALGSGTWDGIEREAHDLLAFLAGRDGAVDGRFGHCWSTLPGAQVRMFRSG